MLMIGCSSAFPLQHLRPTARSNVKSNTIHGSASCSPFSSTTADTETQRQRRQRRRSFALHVRIPRKIQLIQWDDEDVGMQRLNSNDSSSIYSSIDGDYIDPEINPFWYEETNEATINNNDVDKYKDYTGPKDVQMLFKEQLQPTPQPQSKQPISDKVEEKKKEQEEQEEEMEIPVTDRSNVEGAGTQVATILSMLSDHLLSPPPSPSPIPDIPSPPTDQELLNIGWAKAFDSNTGDYYYYTLDQTQTTWDNPLTSLKSEVEQEQDQEETKQAVDVDEKEEQVMVEDEKEDVSNVEQNLQEVEEELEELENPAMENNVQYDLVGEIEEDGEEEEEEPTQEDEYVIDWTDANDNVETEALEKEFTNNNEENYKEPMVDSVMSVDEDSFDTSQDFTTITDQDISSDIMNQNLSDTKQKDTKETGDRMTFEKIHLESPTFAVGEEEEEDETFDDFFLQVYDEYSKQQKDPPREDNGVSTQDDKGRTLLNRSQVQQLVEETLRQDDPFYEEESSKDVQQVGEVDVVLPDIIGRKALGRAEIQRLVEETLRRGEMDDEQELKPERTFNDESVPINKAGRNVLPKSEVQRLVEEALEQPLENTKSDTLENTSEEMEEDEPEKIITISNISTNRSSNEHSGEHLLLWELAKLKSDFDSVQLGIEISMNLAKVHKAWYQDQLLFSFEVKELQSSFRSVQMGLGLVLSLFNVTSEESLELENSPPSSKNIDLIRDEKMEQRTAEKTVKKTEGALSELAQKVDLPSFLSQIRGYDDSKEGKLVMSSFKDLKSLVDIFEKDLVRIKAMDELTTFEKNYKMTKEVQELLWEVSKLTSTSNKIQLRIKKRKKNDQARLSLEDFLADDLEPVGDFLQRTEDALKIERLGWDEQEKNMKREKNKLERKIKIVEDEQKMINAGMNSLQILIKEKEDIIVSAREDVEIELSKWSDEREKLEIEYAQIENLLIEEEENIESIELSLQESKETKSEWITYQEIMLQDRTIVYKKLLQSESEVKELMMDIDDVTESLVTAMRVILKKNDEFILLAKKEVDEQLLKLNKRVQQLDRIKKQFFQISSNGSFNRSNSQLQPALEAENALRKNYQIINPVQRVFSIYQTSQLLPKVKTLSDARRELDKVKKTLEDLIYAKDTSYNSLYMLDIVEIKNAKGTLPWFIWMVFFLLF